MAAENKKVTDIIARDDALGMQRLPWIDVWRRIADYFLPSQGSSSWFQTTTSMAAITRGPSTMERYQVRFDSTAISALKRMCSGVQALITPDNEEWHELAIDGMEKDQVGSERSQWLSAVNTLLFRVRYAPTSGFSVANNLAGRCNGAFGTACILVEDGLATGSRLAIKPPRILYTQIPLSQCKLGVNAQGEHDTFFRRWRESARVLAQRFGKEALSEKTRQLLDDPKRQDEQVEILHAIFPREDFVDAMPRGALRNAPFANIYIEVDARHLVSESGYTSFPVVVPRWDLSESSPYGESPCMVALPDVQGLNVMKRSSLRSFQQHVDPPVAIAHDGVMTRVSMNPGAVNVGGVTAEGKPKIVPLMTNANPGLTMQVLDAERAQVRDGLLNNLFQILVQDREMTAQEALIRAGEKADLLAPNGITMAAAYARMIERELDILAAQGLYESDAYRPPEAMRGLSFSFRSSNPMDRMRRSKKVTAMSQVFQVAQGVATVAQLPMIGDGFDSDEIIRIAVDVTGAPPEMLRTPEEREAIRQQMAEKQAQQDQAQQIALAAKAAKDATPAIQAFAAANGGGAPA